MTARCTAAVTLLRPIPLLALLLALPAFAGCAALDAVLPGGEEPRPVTYEAVRLATSHGDIVAILYANEAPETVAHFKTLVGEGYYNGREFNRIIPGFVIQEVDRTGGTTDDPRRVPLEAGTRAHFSMGAFGIARDVEPDSGGPEFFVMDFGHAHLYGNFTAFAQVIEGMDVVHAIARVDAVSTRPGALSSVPAGLPVHDRIAVEPGVIRRAEIARVTLPADVAAQFPRVVGERTVVDDPPTRYTPEWPANLGVGNASAMTWFVYTPADDPSPDLRDARAIVEGPGGRVALPFVHDPADERILHWTWTPDAPGPHTLALEIRGKIVAAQRVEIR